MLHDADNHFIMAAILLVLAEHELCICKLQIGNPNVFDIAWLAQLNEELLTVDSFVFRAVAVCLKTSKDSMLA